MNLVIDDSASGHGFWKITEYLSWMDSRNLIIFSSRGLRQAVTSGPPCKRLWLSDFSIKHWATQLNTYTLKYRYEKVIFIKPDTLHKASRSVPEWDHEMCQGHDVSCLVHTCIEDFSASVFPVLTQMSTVCKLCHASAIKNRTSLTMLVFITF